MFKSNLYIKELQNNINCKLDEFIALTYPDTLWDAMRYSVLGEGKRLRAILCIESCITFKGTEEIALPLACSIEIIHAQSLIHDDLPCMDNDDFRRGKPSTHKQFGEAIAVLAGDALIPLAYEVFIKNTPATVSDTIKLRILEEFSRTIGACGLVGGQVVDVQNEGIKVDAGVLEYIHSNKTSALYNFSLRSGAMLANCSEVELNSISAYAKAIGLAFQISDDILDITGTKESLGKTPGKDKACGKNTYPSVHGLKESKQELKRLHNLAISSLVDNNIKSEVLIKIADFICNRVN